jgi:exopolysaccharide production protein ExoY
MRRLQGQVVYNESAVAMDEVPVEASGVLSHVRWPVRLPLNSWRYEYVKRAFDICSSLFMILVLLIPGLFIALSILIASPYPVFYTEERIGREGVPFRIWKFRSMRPHEPVRRNPAGAHDGVVLHWRMEKRKHDPRVTSIGRFLRRWSLDELPQLFNVLCGDMSLIGPRPIVKAETHFYRHLLPYYLAATPGLSGLWQVSGRSDVGYDERARLDAEYVQNWSLRGDFRILIRTIPAVLGRVGAR